MESISVSVEVTMKRLLPALVMFLLAVLLLFDVAASESRSELRLDREPNGLVGEDETAAGRPRPEFRLGFKALAEQIPDVVGEPLEDERHDPLSGDTLQRTTKGLMIWRKADNWTAFTDGTTTWASGSLGIEVTSRAPFPRPRVEGLSNIRIGAIHSMQTAYSDGKARYPEEFYSTFRPLWDWVATTDHDFLLSSEEWKSIVENACRQNDGEFVSFVGYEWTSPGLRASPSLGHMSVVFRGCEGLGDRVPASASDPLYDSPNELYRVLEAMDGLAAFAHPNRDGLGFDFNDEATYRNDAVARLVSVANGGVFWSRSWEYASGGGIYSGWQAGETSDSGWPRLALDRGYRLGFVGEYDGHAATIEDARYAYTGVVADSLTRDEIFDGLKARHTYAVYSPYGVGRRIILKASSADFLMGDAFRTESNPLEITLQGATDLPGFRAASLVVNGRIVEERLVSGKEIFERFSAPLSGGDNYLFFVVQAENPPDPRIREPQHRWSMAFTSPMFVAVDR